MTRASLLLAAVLVAGCHADSTRVPGPVGLTSEAQTLAGAYAARAVEAGHGGLLRDVDAERRLQGIGDQLCRHNGFLAGSHRYRLLDSDRLDAFSLPGGRVYFTRRLYERLESDAQLAAVIAHEMAHLVARDHFKPRCRSRAEAIDREEAADRLARRCLRQAGISPRALTEVIGLIQHAQPEEWSSARVRSLDERRHGQELSGCSFGP